MKSYGKLQSPSYAAFACALLTVAAHATPVEANKIKQDELVRHTQELVDSIAIGNQAPWKIYYAEDAIYTDETGKTMDKPALVANVSPLPKGYSGTIKVVKPQSRILGQTAILSYDPRRDRKSSRCALSIVPTAGSS
jgi:hypothetical protein